MSKPLTKDFLANNPLDDLYRAPRKPSISRCSGRRPTSSALRLFGGEVAGHPARPIVPSIEGGALAKRWARISTWRGEWAE